jgi:hypothetical protein
MLKSQKNVPGNYPDRQEPASGTAGSGRLGKGQDLGALFLQRLPEQFGVYY